MNNFADRVIEATKSNRSFLCAGFDPVIDQLPQWAISLGKSSQNTDAAIHTILFGFYKIAIEALAGKVAAIKPNIAFFEQYGPAGLSAFREISKFAQSLGQIVIADAKRGDIGSTAEAYAKAFLGQSSVLGKVFDPFPCDAVTVSPYLGFDTLAPFLKEAVSSNKGIFVLVKTSNPGSGDIQGATQDSVSISDKVAAWITQNETALVGQSGFSSLGAVVGATYPGEATALRAKMPRSMFLIPGMGAQGGTARDAVASLVKTSDGTYAGGLINASRGLMNLGPSTSASEFISALRKQADKFNQEIEASLS